MFTFAPKDRSLALVGTMEGSQWETSRAHRAEAMQLHGPVLQGDVEARVPNPADSHRGIQM